jgi:cytoskeletal protein CcmA (bactofilin family)
MLWDKKTRAPLPEMVPAPRPSPPIPALEMPMKEPMPKPLAAPVPSPGQTVLGPSLALRGELAGAEDLLIEGQFEGSIQLRDHCLTVGLHGQVKADIKAGRVIIEGSVTGNISAQERIEIHKSGRVLGDLVSPGIAIEDGAYFKGSIEILREEPQKGDPILAHTSLPESGR